MANTEARPDAGAETKACAACGIAFECGANAGGCWCMELPPLTVPDPGRGCYCRDCLQRATAVINQVG